MHAAHKGRASGDDGAPGVGRRKKVTRLKHCPGEACRRITQRFLRKASSMTPMQDVRQQYLGARFRAATPDLKVRSGFLGLVDLHSAR
eukprot:1051809-Pyramimonas_sp.AAC.1